MVDQEKVLTDCGIIHTVNKHFVDSGFLESVLTLKVSRNLGCGSRGCEGSGKTDNDDILSSAIFSHVNCFYIRKSLEEFDRRKFRRCCESKRDAECTGGCDLHTQKGGEGEYFLEHR